MDNDFNIKAGLQKEYNSIKKSTGEAK